MDGKENVSEAPSNGTCANNEQEAEGTVQKTAAQLKKEAKRQAKLEKFAKKQSQSASNKDSASNEV